MSKDNMELMAWGDGTIRLVFWDAIHGDDITYALKASGQVCKNEGEPQEQWLSAAEFVHDLRALALRWKAEAEAQERQQLARWAFLRVCQIHHAWIKGNTQV